MPLREGFTPITNFMCCTCEIHKTHAHSSSLSSLSSLRQVDIYMYYLGWLTSGAAASLLLLAARLLLLLLLAGEQLLHDTVLAERNLQHRGSERGATLLATMPCNDVVCQTAAVLLRPEVCMCVRQRERGERETHRMIMHEPASNPHGDVRERHQPQQRAEVGIEEPKRPGRAFKPPADRRPERQPRLPGRQNRPAETAGEERPQAPRQRRRRALVVATAATGVGGRWGPAVLPEKLRDLETSTKLIRNF
eukprot:SAG22_NODE_3070_length_1964_cov_1.622520_2_plen_250_part_00